ncbi:uncharacterized protein LOC106166720 [Lingula anatina]|uniref:Uncharacterized protein LOC106166720 n=1 Tax=Lingula anatina TaxID=7574 RepID=A0A1S3IRW8_LINAN|nr:uncharacterized protein LOC106166720 [Lingula anatina]|eukprot:XP_013400818.1 uncharacterized protein LOC106166720 [Lingula anatina]
MSVFKTAEYGSWKSPVSSAIVSEGSISLAEVHVDSAGSNSAVYWSELRPKEGGRYVVCSASVGGDGGVEIQEWTPQGFNARTRVHEYGGGAFIVHNNVVYFSNFADQRLYKQTSPSEPPQPLTPEGCGWRYADGQFSVKLNCIFCVREDHSGVVNKSRKEAENTVVVINLETQEQKVLASGADFYSCPRVSPDGTKLCWMQWFHPNMPWDNTEIWMADLIGDQVVAGTAKKVAGGEGISVMYPGWTVDNQLLYLGDQTEWWNLYTVVPSGEHVNLSLKEEEVGNPHWTFARYAYAVDPCGSGKIATICGGELGILDPKTKTTVPLDTGFKNHSYVNYLHDGHICCIASSPTQFPCVIRVNAESGKVDICKESAKLPVDRGYISIPEKITWPTAGGQSVYGYFYLPKNKDFQAPPNSLPPLLVRAHGGPTSCASSALNMKQQYWTSRGFAVLDVDYRGSTGYGRTYRGLLNGNWGVYDVDDCCHGAEYLADQGKVDRNKLCIDGGSAGGYTTLACLAFRDVFKAGCSFYGVADVALLAGETHKFESRYLDTCIAPYTPENYPIYDSRSPIKHIEKFNCPIIFFQGDEDEIVPPNQAKLMFDEIKAKGIPAAHVLFEGEQHGFRKSENIEKCLDGEFYFFAKVFGFEPADKGYQVEIVNL